MIDDYYLVNGDHDTLMFGSFDGKKELLKDVQGEYKKCGEFELRERRQGECEIIFRHMVDPLGDEEELEEHLQRIIISYFQALKDRGVEFSFIDQESFQTTERILLNAVAGEVTRLFQDKVKQYKHKVFYASRIADGKRITFTHFYKDIQWSKENHTVEVTHVIYAPRVNRRFSGPPTFGKALEIHAWQIQTNRVWISAKYSPFFASIVEDVLSKFEQLNTNPTEISKTNAEKWKPWEHMPDATKEERLLVKLACEHKSSGEIAKILSCEPGSVDNKYNRLRKDIPKARIPYRQRNRNRKKLIEID
jgi:hypothetical protein